MHIEIIRDLARGDAILGTLSVESLTLYTLELPWLPIDGAACGKPGDSCVPAGDYDLVLHDSEKHPKTFALVAPRLGVYHQPGDVPAGCIGRSDCLVHVANYASQLLGCIALGRGRSFVNGYSMVSSSRDALGDFNRLVQWTAGHTLSISEAFHESN